MIVALDEGRFTSRLVSAGIESGDWVEILSGIDAGERVVVSGQFLIDSEASLKASLVGGVSLLLLMLISLIPFQLLALLVVPGF